MRKKLILPVAALALTSLLAACSASETPTSSPTEDETTPDTSTEGEGTEEPAAEGGGLTIWVDENRKPALEQIADTFTADHGLEVEIVSKNFDDIRTDFIAQAPSGSGPDIVVGAHDWLGGLIVDGVVDSVDLGERAAEISQVALDAVSWDGQLYGLPYAVESLGLIRNVDLAPEPISTSWDTALEYAATVGTKFQILIPNATGDAGYYNYAFQTAFGAPIFVQNEDGSFSNTPGFGGENGEAFANWLADMGKNGLGVLNTDINADISYAEFAAGNSPYVIGGPWSIGTYTDAGMNVAVDPIPSPTDAIASPFVGVQAFYLSAYSQNKLLANEFLVNYIGSDEGQQVLYEADPRLPAFASLAESLADDPIISGFIAAAANGTPMPNIPEMGSVWDFWGVTQESIINGSADPVEAWNKFVSDFTAAIS